MENQVDASESETAAETGDDTEANTPVLAVGPLPETLSGLSQTITKYVNVWGVHIVGVTFNAKPANYVGGNLLITT